jgi:hypothetical protein
LGQLSGLFWLIASLKKGKTMVHQKEAQLSVKKMRQLHLVRSPALVV